VVALLELTGWKALEHDVKVAATNAPHNNLRDRDIIIFIISPGY